MLEHSASRGLFPGLHSVPVPNSDLFSAWPNLPAQALASQSRSFLELRDHALFAPRLCPHELQSQDIGGEATMPRIREAGLDPRGLQLWRQETTPNDFHNAVVQQSPTRARPNPSFQPWQTTLVVRNIPPRLTQERILQLWPCTGNYDLICVPYSVKQRRFARYMFINFTSHEAMMSFVQQWQGTLLPDDVFGSSAGMPLDMLPAKLQGLRNNLLQHQAAVAPGCHQPFVFQQGRRVDFRELSAQIVEHQTDQTDQSDQAMGVATFDDVHDVHDVCAEVSQLITLSL